MIHINRLRQVSFKELVRSNHPKAATPKNAAFFNAALNCFSVAWEFPAMRDQHLFGRNSLILDPQRGRNVFQHFNWANLHELGFLQIPILQNLTSLDAPCLR